MRQAEDANPLFITVRKPYAPVKTCTIGRWLKRVMADSAIDTSVFLAQCTCEVGSGNFHNRYIKSTKLDLRIHLLPFLPQTDLFIRMAWRKFTLKVNTTVVSFKWYHVVNWLLLEALKYNYTFLKDCSNPIRRINCTRCRIPGDNIVSFLSTLPCVYHL